jgi:GTPase SAR1 family protein
MIGLQNAGKTSLLRVLAVSLFLMRKQPPVSTSSVSMHAS